jgi:hypothetical protein
MLFQFDWEELLREAFHGILRRLVANPTYRLTIDLNALNHLGINLYSSVPAVVSEVVANAWDADAENVNISIDSTAGTVTITDDGCGMSEADVNDRYLKVGYSKREREPGDTPIHHRKVMGRKGIGKLSLFSIADTIEVKTAKQSSDGKSVEKNGFTMRAKDIRQRIEKSGGVGDYIPDSLPRAKVNVTKGTRIVLRDLKGKNAPSDVFLRRRLARRFSIIGPEYNFAVSVNGTPIDIADRDYFKKVQFVWYFGDDSKKYAGLCKNAKRSNKLGDAVNAIAGYHVSGWIGTFDEQKSIDDGNNTIVVLARGRLVQEDLLKDLDEAGLFTKYLIGEIRADFLDFDDHPDIATSDRQRLREDDPRYRALKDFLQAAVKKDVKLSWTKWRNEISEESARKNSAIDEWFVDLSKNHQKHARELFRKIETLQLPDEDSKRELYKQSILAFENLALRDNLQALSKIETESDLNQLAEIVGSMDEIEAARYYQIVKGRLEVLRKLDKMKGPTLEKVVHEHIYNHLWLLDPSWERASTDTGMEVIIGKEFGKITKNLSPEEKAARIDIKYQTAAGKHIVIELKKYDRKVKAVELAAQIDKYRGALIKVLEAKYPGDPQLLEFICLVGSRPTGSSVGTVEKILDAMDARYITYDTLLKQTRESYSDYLLAQSKVDRIQKLVESI